MATVTDPPHSRQDAVQVEPSRSIMGFLAFPATADGHSPVISRIEWTGPALNIHSSQLFSWSAGTDSNDRKGLKNLIERLFRSPAVKTCDIDRNFQKLTVHLADGFLTTPLVLNQITQALADSRLELVQSHAPVAIWDEAPTGSFSVAREGHLLTTWQVLEDSPSRIVLRQPALHHDQELAGLTQSLLETYGEISKFTIDKRHGMLSISAIPGQSLDRSKILQSLEQVSSEASALALHLPYPKAGIALPAMTLALAATAQWFNPVVWPVPAVLIVYLNWRMIVRSFKDIGKGTLGLPLLTTLIILGTLAGGALTASALMTVLARYWQNQYARMLSTARREWLGQLTLPTGSATVSQSNGLTRVMPIGKIQINDVLELTAPAVIPADGEWIDGDGEVEDTFSGFGETPDNQLFAGGHVTRGHVRMKVRHTGPETRMARLRAEILNNSGTNRGETALNKHGQRFAEKTVLPTLALAGLGLATGGIGTAVAVMRPDYSTGVGLGEGLDQLRLGGDALHEGFLIRNASAVLNAHEIQVWVIESATSSKFAPVVPGQILAEIHSPTRIDLVNQDQTLTLQGIPPLLNDVDRVRLFHLLRERGLTRIGWVGDASRFPNTAKAADLALSTSSELDSKLNPASAVSLTRAGQPDWNRLFDLVTEQAKEQKNIRRMALIPNVVAVTGAFTMGFTSLATVILTNAGIWSIQRRTRQKSQIQRSYTRVPTAGNS